VESSIHRTVSTPSAGVIGADDEPVYRTISVTALVSLLLGIAAPLCLMAPLLFAIPIAGAALALLAMRQISTSDGALIGRTAALVGLALCTASVSAAVARAELSEQMLSRQARAAALEWIELLQAGDVDGAFELTMASRKGPPPPSPLNGPLGGAGSALAPIDEFRNHSVVHFLLVHAPGAAVQYKQDEAFDPGVRGAALILQEYDVAASELPDGEPTTRVQLTMQRVRGVQGTPAQWLVANYQSDGLVPHSHDDHAGHSHAHPHSH